MELSRFSHQNTYKTEWGINSGDHQVKGFSIRSFSALKLSLISALLWCDVRIEWIEMGDLMKDTQKVLFTQCLSKLLDLNVKNRIYKSIFIVLCGAMYRKTRV